MDSTIVQLFRVKVTQLEMMELRGYTIEDSERWILTSTPTNFINHFRQLPGTIRSNLTKLYVKPDGKRIKVYYLESPPGRKHIGKEYIKGIVDDLYKNENDYKDAILIAETGLTDDSGKIIKGMSAFNIQYFLYSEISFNPLKHALQPQFRLMDDNEAKDLLVRNNVFVNQMPQIRIDDPVTKFYGARPGQMFEIKRNNLFINSLIPEPLAYRVVSSRLMYIDRPTPQKRVS